MDLQWTPSMAEVPRPNAETIAKNLERHCPYPDWACFTQTLLGPSESQNSEDNFLGERQPATSKESNRYKFHIVKGSQEEFPLKKRYVFAFPLSLPDTSGQLEAYRYRGNCLDVLDMNKKTLVIYPGSECIKISILKQNASQRIHHKLYDHIVCPITKPVYQIVSKLVADNGYIVSRFKKTVDFTCIKGSSEKVDSVTVNPKHKFRTTGVCLSNVLPGYFSMSYEDGAIRMFDVNSSKSLWKGNMQENNASPSKTSYHCNFGNHPLSLYVNNNESVWLCDTRDKAQRLVHSSQVLGDDICLLSHCGEKPYYYLVNKSCLYVFDERSNKMPIMKWQHMLLSSPSLLTKMTLGRNETIMLSSTEDNQTCAVVNEWVQSSSSTWCRSMSFPKHFNYTDTIDYAHIQGISFNTHTKERISSPNYGLKLCIFKSQIHLLTLNKFGDVFTQHFTTKGKSDGKESSGKNIIIQWQEKVMDVMKVPDCTNYYNLTFSDKKHEVLQELPMPEKLPTQKKQKKMIWDLRPIEKNESKHFWQSTIVDDYIQDESNVTDRISKYFPREITENYTIDKNKTHAHPLTNKLLTLWKEEPPADRGARYHSAPLLLNRLKRIPETMKGMDSQQEVEDMDEPSPSRSEETKQEGSPPKYFPNASQTFQPSQSFSQGSKISKKKNKRKRVDGF